MLKKIFLIIIVIIIMVNKNSFAQVGWSALTNMSDVELKKIIFLNDTIGFSVGSYDQNYAAIYKTTNRGINWNSFFLAFGSERINSISFANNNTGFAVGANVYGLIFLRTNNQGNSWTSQSIGISNSYILYDIIFSNQNTGYITGSGGLILKTSNGGSNWIQQNSGIGNSILKIEIANDNPDNVYAVGWASFVLKTTNGGSNWTVITFPTGEGITSLSVVNSNTGYVSGSLIDFPQSPLLYKTTNGGITWTNLTSSIPNGNRFDGAISFIDENNGYLAISRIYKTTNGGFNWRLQESYPWSTIYSDIFILNPNNLFVTCTWQSIYNGIILKTSSGGDGPPNPPTNLSCTRRNDVNKLNWVDHSQIELGYKIQRKDLPDTLWQTIDSVSFNITTFNDSNATANVRYRVFAYNEFGNSSNSNEAIPVIVGVNTNISELSNFILDQNYPNPFNPNTIISYKLAVSSFAKLKVYDILGNGIATLVNENQNAGNYSVEFDASNYPSGIYYYKLEAGDFSEVKKMILLK